MSDKMSIDKNEPSKDNSEDESIESSPENDAGPAPLPESQPVKRKGGRKPIYATSEERKQRNRQAQAAFRERRTEYIKQLEETIRVHESNLSNLQAAHRSAADECLMLRYKNSLLERILLEKGIDVQAELRAKTGSPNLGPTHMPQNMVQPPPIQRTILGRHHHARRSGSSIAPKVEPSPASVAPSIQSLASTSSPKTRPTPPSHAASPTNHTPGFRSQPTAASPAGGDHAGMRPAIPAPMKQPMLPMQGPMAAAAARQQQQMMQSGGGMGSRPNPYYQTPAFQNHIEQLEQEYDAQNEVIDEVEPDTPGPGPYPGAFANNTPHGLPMQQPPPPPQQHQPVTTSAPGQPIASPTDQTGPHTQGQGYPSMTQLLDPALDWDPFGLSASMAFPTHFSFDTSNMR